MGFPESSPSEEDSRMSEGLGNRCSHPLSYGASGQSGSDSANFNPVGPKDAPTIRDGDGTDAALSPPPAPARNLDAGSALAARLERLSSPEPMSGCVLWLGGVNGPGYGMLKIDGVGRMAHRVAYEVARGPIPPGLVLDHRCRVRSCIRVEHLEPVTNPAIGIKAATASIVTDGREAQPHQWEANARVMGAAPELLDVVRRVLRYERSMDPPEPWKVIVRDAETALAKATQSSEEVGK